ncbi:hypothetical protein BJY04DRAFT_224300 [Aspergillus karnatakaensis]|uniref:uncharacterized protein n=1 Tax=Aspergillus karnatakaensis TaxID=1810916 RepID=UPI003CCD57C1
MVCLIRDGATVWDGGIPGLAPNYDSLSSSARYWASQHLISDIAALSAEQTTALIKRLDGFCVQIGWEELRSKLPPTALAHFGQVAGELLIYLTVHERLFENPFWYLDGKDGPDDVEDVKFSDKLNYLFERFYRTSPTFGVLWKSQTQRLANAVEYVHSADPKFGRYNRARHEGAPAGLADDLLRSEPFCWLLASPVTDKARKELEQIFHQAVKLMIDCETCANGIPVLRGIEELGGVYKGESEYVSLNTHCWPPGPFVLKGQEILVVARPGLVYVDGIKQQYVQDWAADQTEYRCAPNVKFGWHNEKRQEDACDGFADRLLASEPFCWLLKGSVDSPPLPTEGRDAMSEIFQKATAAVIFAETRTNGQPVIRGIEEIGGVYKGDTSLVKLRAASFRLKPELYLNRKILLVTLPSVVYIDSVTASDQYAFIGASELMCAEVLAEFVPEDDPGDTSDKGGQNKGSSEDHQDQEAVEKAMKAKADEHKGWSKQGTKAKAKGK